MTIHPARQTLHHSCLAAALLMLTGKRFTPKLEASICFKGSRRTYPFYVVGIPFEFSQQLREHLRLYVDNKFFAGILQKALKRNKRITVKSNRIDLDFMKLLCANGPLVCHVDDHFLGDYSHASHFIVVEHFSKARVTIIDPYHGKRRVISQQTLMNSVQSLKGHIRMCPLVYQLE